MVAFHSALGDLSLFIIFLESFHYKIFFVFHLLLLSLLSLLLLPFVLASNRICLRTWHVATRWGRKGSCRTFLRRQPAYLQLFDCLTQRLEAQKNEDKSAEVAIWKTLHAHHYLPENNNNKKNNKHNDAGSASTVFQPHLSG